MNPKQPASKDAASNEAQLKAVPTAASSSGSVDQIRDIIFGTQMHEYEERFNSLERRLVNENKALQDSLELRMNEAISALTEERKSREAAFGELLTKITTYTDELRDENDLAKKSISEQFKEVQQQFEEQGSSSQDEQRKQQDRMASIFHRLADELGSAD